MGSFFGGVGITRTPLVISTALPVVHVASGAALELTEWK